MNNLKNIEYKEIKALVREGTSDEFVVKEVFGGTYNKLKVKPGDVVIDFGLNIGMFTCWAITKGAKEVYSYEPEYDNFCLAEQNVKLNGLENKAHLFNAAVVGNDDKKRSFSINLKKNKGAHSLVAKRGRDTVDVDCVNFNDIVSKVNPDIIKMDIEGGEYECLKNIQCNLAGVRELIMEFHHAHLLDVGKEVIFNEVLDILRKHFKNVEFRKDPKGAWVSNIYCTNY